MPIDDAKDDRKGLIADERGAIVLMGVFMSAFLVGGLWYVMGIGESIVYRETVQAGADSAAFTAAVYHARGMNVVAMVNIVIGAVMAIAAAAAMLAQIASMCIALATSLCEMSKTPPITLSDGSTMDYSHLSFACEKIEPAKQLLIKMQAVIAQVNADTDSMLKSLSDAQKLVGKTAPWLGGSQSAKVASAHAPYVVAGGSGSPSMVPRGTRYGLPIQDEPFEKACNRGKIIVGKLVSLLIPVELTALLEYMDVSVASKLPSKVCRGNGQGWDHKWEFFDKDEPCKKFNHRDDEEKKKKCEEDIDKDKDEPEEKDFLKEIDPKDKSTKGPHDLARNGNDYMQVYTVVRGNSAFIQKSDKGVEAPTWGGRTVAGPGTMNEDLAVAQAEFFYDQTPTAIAEDSCWEPCPAGLGWNSYKENVLWNLRWRARLRRYRMPTAVDFNVLANAVPASDVGHTEGLDTFNGGVGMASPLTSGHQVADATGEGAFIGGGSELIH